MRPAGYFLEGLLDLPQIADPAARRAAFRQSIVSLSRAIDQEGPGPLEGVHPNALLPGVRAALETGLVDQLDWLSPEAAAVALYEIAAALPAGAEKRDVGRRVAAHTYDGNAVTFAAVATRMAYGSGKGLAGTPVRARVALALELPTHRGSRIDAMALALASRRELAREWVARLSTGSLPSRRLAARLIERAAAEAVRCAAQGDDHLLRIFRTEAVASAWKRLLADRESLVWRHVAVARGLLAGPLGELFEQIERDLAPALTPTEWRRAATSLAAALMHDPDAVATRIRTLLDSEPVRRDPGVATSLLAGLARSSAYEPEAAEEQMSLVVARDRGIAAEPLEEASRDQPAWCRTSAADGVRRELRSPSPKGRADAGANALAAEIALDLEADPRPDRPSRHLAAHALALYATTGAKAASAAAQEALLAAREELASLERSRPDLTTGEGRSTFGLLRNLDIALLESAVLGHVLSLDRRSSDPSSTAAVDELRGRLGELLLGWEVEPLRPNEPIAHPTTRLRRLRALLHLLDAEVVSDDDDGRAAAVRARWGRAVRVLVNRLVRDPRSVLERTLCAGLARALDGLVRAEACDVVDALLFVAFHLRDPRHVAILVEASMQPDFVAALDRYGAFLAASAAVAPPPSPALGASPEGASVPPADALARKLGALATLARESSIDGSSREEALRAVLVHVARALEALSEATSLTSVATPPSGTISIAAALQSSTTALAQLVAAARHRLTDDDHARRPVVPRPGPDLATAFDRAAAGDASDVPAAIARFVQRCEATLPPAIVDVVRDTLARASALPARTAADQPSLPPSAAQFPPWMPSRRTLGGFYVLRTVGAGAVGSVFIVKRIEERTDPNAEMFALKVPEYGAGTVRQLSEQQFLQLFRDEASALLSLPAHPNLARFVTFDLAARPKPILVMELVEGITLERLVAAGRMTVERAFRLLDGVLAGLVAMHAVGIGHLDVKPSNVILRSDDEPVLVDFGLSGRHIRDGCGTSGYGAPEIWGAGPDGHVATPMPADVYASACLIYETLTGRPLIDAESEVAAIARHIAHDGWPGELRRWWSDPLLAPLAELLASALRRDPRARVTAPSLRQELRRLGATLGEATWPLAR